MPRLKFGIIFSLLWSIIFQAHLYSQAPPTDIDDVYQRSDQKSWGQLFNWALGRTEFQKSYALVIGIGNYQRDWPKLEAPGYDAQRIRDFLIRDEGFDYVVTLTNAKATKPRISKLMEEIFPEKVGANDRFFFYFSGHGTQRVIGAWTTGYLVLPVSGEKSFADMISMEDISRWDNLLYPTRHVLFMLDCCFSGLAGQQTKRSLRDKTLERLSQYAHHLITAGTAQQTSVASLREWQGSLFTDAFLKAVAGRGDLSSTDFSADGVVCLKEFMKYVDDRIDAESVRLKNRNPRAQEIRMSPQMADLKENEGEFFFITKSFKNQKRGNLADQALNFGWPLERKGSIEAPPIVPETQPPSEAATYKPARITPVLRPDPKTLSVDQVKVMLNAKGFFDSDWNTSVAGWNNEFISQTLNGAQVVSDQSTGLMWQQGGSAESKTFQDAEAYITDLNRQKFAGFTDWRLPTLEEAMSLMESKTNQAGLYIDNRFDSKQSWIWTADKYGGSARWYVSFSLGSCLYWYLIDGRSFVRAVRFGLSSPE